MLHTNTMKRINLRIYGNFAVLKAPRFFTPEALVMSELFDAYPSLIKCIKSEFPKGWIPIF